MSNLKYIIKSMESFRITSKGLIFLVFSFFFLVNIASSGGHFDEWDGVETFLVTESMVLKHSAKLYPDVPSIGKLYFDIHQSVAVNKVLQTGRSESKLDPMYTLRSLFLSAVALPFYYAALVVSVSPIIVVALFVNSLMISFTCVVVFCFSMGVYKSRKIAFVLSLIFGVCSFIWPYNTTLFPQPLQTLCIFTSAYFIYLSTKQATICCGKSSLERSSPATKPGQAGKEYEVEVTEISRQGFVTTMGTNNHSDKNSVTNSNMSNRAYFAGLGALLLGMSVLAHPSSIIVIPGFLAYFIFSSWRARRSLAYFLIVLAIMSSLIGFMNYLRFGSFLEFGYGPLGSLSAHHGLEGLLGLLASPGAGLIFFFPISILLPLAFKFMYRENKGLFFLSAYVIIVSWLYFGTNSCCEPLGWSGAGAWGPRYLMSVLPFITIVSGALLVHLKRLDFNKRLFLKITIVVLCTAGFTVNLLAILTWFMYGYGYGWEKEQLWKSKNSFDVMTWNPSYSPIILHVKALISGYVAHIQPAHDYRSYGLAPCSYDLYLLCKFGPTSMTILLAPIAILAAIIIREISSQYDAYGLPY